MADRPFEQSDREIPSAVKERWRAPRAGRHYVGQRFASSSARTRDPRLVARLLKRFGPASGANRILDVPCGTGRLHSLLASEGQDYLGLDVSEFMLQQGACPHLARADVHHLPLQTASFDVVVCCRLLHHLAEPAMLRAALAELLRVARGPLIASFWDATSIPAWRARHGLRRRSHPETRVSITKHEIAEHLSACGAEVLGYAHSARFLSQQTFFAAQSVQPRTRIEAGH